MDSYSTSLPRKRKKIGVPRGILRFLTLMLLQKMPMSGVEVMEEIEKHTLWKPSPGSIYPLLSRLNEKGCIQQTGKSEPRLKRYMLTEKGTFLLDKMVKNREETREKRSASISLYVGYFEPGAHPQKILELNKSVRTLLTGYWDLLDTLRERYSTKTVEEAINTVEQAVKSIEELVKKLEHRMV